MDLRALQCFIAVADTLHFRRAAERVHLTQPALSQRIRALEDALGVALFERDRRRVALTAAGQAFLGPARASVAQAELARRQAQQAARGELGRLRLGFTVIAFYSALPRAVRQFRERYPGVQVDLLEMNSPAVEQALSRGEIDLGVLHPPVAEPDLVCHPLPDSRLVLALPAGHPLARRKVIPVQALAGQPLLIAPRQVGPSIYDRVIGMFQTHGFSPDIVQEVMPMTVLVGLVATGAGIGFVTEGIAAATRPGVVFRPVRPEPPRLPLAMAWRAPALTRAGELFVAQVERAMR
ncbi:LysR family transcriptional regulator [Bordetella sp. 2513F-2]